MLLDIAFPTYDENETNYLESLDRDLLTFANEYKVNKWSFASIINNEILKKCGYFESMPGNLSFISGFGQENIAKMIEKKDVDSFPASGYGMTPAACLHIYPMLEKYRKKDELITTLQRVYRYEQGNFEETRLWEFWVREFVAVGSEEYVKSFLRDFEKKALDYSKERFCEARIRRANDFFYPSRENKIIQRMQIKNDLKHELVIDIDGKDVACASFNYHKTHFSKIFNFDERGNVVTGCVGFGLNRWLVREKNIVNHLYEE